MAAPPREGTEKSHDFSPRKVSDRFGFSAKVVERFTSCGGGRTGGTCTWQFLIMLRRPSVSPAFLGLLAATSLLSTSTRAEAQVPPPPLPPPEGSETESEPESEPESTESDADADGSFEASAQGGVDTSTAESSEGADAYAEPWEQPVSGAPPTANASDVDANDDWFRRVSLRRQNALSGSTGLHRIIEAGSGAPGTFRINLVGSYFGKNRFLCRDNIECPDPVTRVDQGDDTARHSDAVVSISATPLSFLEVFLSLHNSATSNTNGTPQLLQVVGDTHLGLKGFLPEKPDQIFGFGGQADLHLLTGTGGVGLAGGATSFSMTGLASLNLNNRTEEQDRIPLRAHVNLGYKFDNSGAIVRDLENTDPPNGRGRPIERTERYGLDISRVDAFEIGLGAEYINDYVRPFLEWSIDVPVNRQKYVCNIQDAEVRGDECLGVAAGFATSPSRFTLGARVFPWQASGLALMGAIDLGTGGTKRFLEETTPEAPYRLWFGLGYAVDTVPPKPEKVEVASPYVGLQPEVRRYVLGQVVEAASGAAIPDAIVRYEGVPMTGLVADEAGQFISQDLPPGEYTFHVFAEQFRDGTCTVTIPESAPPQAAGAPPTSEPDSSEETIDEQGAPPVADTPYMDADGNLLAPLRCELKELPKVADVTGLLVDSVSGGPVPDAKVRITDNLNRSLELAVDSQGSFQFRNVPFGEARLTVTSPGYMTTVLPIKIESRKTLEPHVLMNKRPEKLNLTVGARQITLGSPIEFVSQSADVAVDSMVMVEQLAEALKENAELENVEIQVHTDDSGSPTYSRRLSQQRADRIKQILTQLGVAERRLTAKGYGPDQPLAPNVSDANRARNNRVQIMLK